MSETSLKNSLLNLDYELYSEDYSIPKKARESIWKQFSRLIHLLKIIAGITDGITDTISTSGNIRSNFLKPW
jgi:hypothetical protein